MLGAVATGLGFFSLAAAASPIAVGLVLLGIGTSVLGMRFRALFGGIPAANLAVQLLSRGEPERAVALLDALPRHTLRSPLIRRAAALVRSTAALHGGRLDDAEREATHALSGRPDPITASGELQQQVAAHAVRALARAGRGDEAGALADVAVVEASPDVMPEALARAKLARAILLTRAGRHDELATLLREDARLLWERTLPRERAIVRGLRKLARARKTSVYREPAARDRDEATARGALASWAATFAPELAAHVNEPAEVRGDQHASPERSAPYVTPAAAAPAPRRLRRAFVVVAGVVTFLAVWQLLTPAPRTAPETDVPEATLAEPAPVSPLSAVLQALGPIGLIWAVRAYTARLALRGSRRLNAARLRHVAGGEGAERALEEILRRRAALKIDAPYVAMAATELARAAVHRGDYALAVQRCDAGLAHLHAMLGGAKGAADLPLPALIAERAVASAAAGRSEEADGAVGRLRAEFPGYHDLPAALLRVEMLGALARGDVAGAAAAARARGPEVPFPFAEDVLADVVVASVHAVPSDARERIEEELREHPEIAAWIDQLTPGLRARVRVAPTEGSATTTAPSDAGSMEGHGDALEDEDVAGGNARRA